MTAARCRAMPLGAPAGLCAAPPAGRTRPAVGPAASHGHRLLPHAHVVKIGGQSMIDRGRRAVFPVQDEVRAALADNHLIIGTGAGTRARHAYSVGVDLGMPTAVLATLGTGVALQNARILAFLLAKEGIPLVLPNEFGHLPLYLAERHAVIFPGMPPYTFWEHNRSSTR